MPEPLPCRRCSRRLAVLAHRYALDAAACRRRRATFRLPRLLPPWPRPAAIRGAGWARGWAAAALADAAHIRRTLIARGLP